MPDNIDTDGEPALIYAVEAAQGPVKLRYFAPPEALRTYFGSLYIFTESADRYLDVTRADVPQLRFMVQGSGNYHFHDGEVAATPEICLLGPTLGATRFELDGPACVIGVSLLPAGWVSLDGGDASLLADRLRDMSAEKKGAMAALLSRLQDMHDPDAIAAHCWSVLAQWVRPLPDASWRLLEAVDAWLMGEGSPRIEALVEQTGLSPRQLARLTNQHSWQELCEDGRFYDQSHFIREIKHFIGLTPHQLQTEPTAVAQLTLLRRSLGGDVAVLNRFS